MTSRRCTRADSAHAPAHDRTRHCTENKVLIPGAVLRGEGGSRMALKHPFRQAEFLTTAAEWRQLPADGAPEIAFAGRSNAGKSSAINALANHGRLAFASRTPGRTQQINMFALRSGALVADLPGYGYAAVSKTVKRDWQAF